MNNSLINKYKGMLWGLVVGDCLGSPIQFTGKDDHPYISKMEPAVSIYGRDLPKGYWTDDSSMAFCLMESFIRQKHFDLNDIANNFIRWYEDGFLSSVPGWSFDIGGATDDAIANIKTGSLVNGEEDSQGNGSLMRYAPALCTVFIYDPVYKVSASNRSWGRCLHRAERCKDHSGTTLCRCCKALAYPLPEPFPAPVGSF